MQLHKKLSTVRTSRRSALISAYTRLLLDITKSRRRRHAKANRRETYSSYRLNVLGAAMRRGKRGAIVVSDEDTDGDQSTDDDRGEAGEGRGQEDGNEAIE